MVFTYVFGDGVSWRAACLVDGILPYLEAREGSAQEVGAVC